ncbi:MAG: hypothetical protein MRQ09_01725 [Candidatus Midichloria sp.]|nr:hypothetical protein [Candidatus Midichloria sp.]
MFSDLAWNKGAFNPSMLEKFIKNLDYFNRSTLAPEKTSPFIFGMQENGIRALVAKPSTDLVEDVHSAIDIAMAGNNPLKKQLEQVKEYINNENTRPLKFVIPIVQSRSYFFGLFQRRHWTMLELDVFDQANNIRAHHYDSKGWFASFLYSLEPIRQAIAEVFMEKGIEVFMEKGIEMKTSYLGHQSIIDNTNCGRFVISYINCKASKPSIDIEKNFNYESVRENYTTIHEIVTHNVKTIARQAAAREINSPSTKQRLQSTDFRKKAKSRK